MAGDYMPPTFSVECVGYGGQAKLDIKELWYTVDIILKVTHAHIDGVQQRNSRRWDVTLFPECQDTLDRIKYEHMDSEIHTCNGKIVRIIDPLEIVTEVTVRKVPMYWSYQRIVNIFSTYGSIKHMEKERYRDSDAEGTELSGKWNGNLRIQMIIRSKLPSGITISDETLEIFHRNQEHTCSTCGLTGHTFYECTTPKSQRLNIFDLDDFPGIPARPQPQNNDQDEESDTESFSSASLHGPELDHESNAQGATRENDAAQGINQEEDLLVSQRATQRNNAEATHSANQENTSAQSATSTPLGLTTQITTLFSSETPVVNPSTMQNLTNSLSASELSSEEENVTESENINIAKLDKDIKISSVPSNQDNQRKLSERRPRGSSTTSHEETLIGASGNRNDVIIENENESEPFSQVFINRTKQRMKKKKQKTSEDISSKALWV